MSTYTYKNGKWFDKKTGEEVTLPSRADSWSGGSLQIIRDIDGYDCPITGKFISSRAEHRENLKRTGCRNLEPGESRDAIKRKEQDFNDHCKRTAREMIASVAHTIEF